MNDTPFNVAVVDDHQMMRTGICATLNNWSRGRVVLEATDGLDLEQRLAALGAKAPPIHLAVVDLMMPRRNGVQTVAWLRTHAPHIKVLCISFDATWKQEEEVHAAGAMGLIGKSTLPQDLYAILNHVMDHGVYRNPLLKRPPGKLPKLTPKETELAQQLCHHAQPKREAMADTLHIRPRTVDRHTDNLFRKLKVHGRVSLLYGLVRLGLVKCPCGGVKGYVEPEEGKGG